MSNGNWRDNEIRELLYVRADAEIDKQIQGTARDSVVYDQITNLLRDRGVIRTKAQVISKLKALKKQYHDHNGRSAAGGKKTWPYFGLSEVIWGSGTPVAVVASVEDAVPTSSSCAETGTRIASGPGPGPGLATSSSASSSSSTAAAASSSTGGLETQHNDTGDETEVSVNDSGLSTGTLTFTLKNVLFSA